MIPIAFIGGFGVAAIIGKAGSCQGALQPIRVPIRFTKATGDGRQLTSADNMLLPGTSPDLHDLHEKVRAHYAYLPKVAGNADIMSSITGNKAYSQTLSACSK